MTRIRYYKYLDDLVSKYFKTPDDEVYIQIRPDFSFRILNAEGNSCWDGKSKNLAAAKKAAKKILITLGTIFESEVRPRIKNNEGRTIKKEVLNLYQESIKEDK